MTAGVRAAVVVSTVLLALGTGCAHPAPTGPRSAGRATDVSTPAVRIDPEPIARRFSRLGGFVAVHWQGWALGVDTGGVPGPTDVRIQALVVLRPDVLASVVSRYAWRSAPAAWDVSLSAELRPFVPAGGAWRVSERGDVRPVPYRGPVYLDTSSGTVFLDVVGG